LTSGGKPRLSDRAIKEYVLGIDFCIDNAQRLLDDAKILERAGSIPSTIGLAVFAWEEIGKAMMLMNDLVQERDFVKDSWMPHGRFMDHKLKLLAPNKYRTLVGQPPDPFPHEAVEEMIKTTHEGRLRSFYVDWSEQAGWFSPTNRKYVGDMTLLLGSIMPGAEGWLRVVKPFWHGKRESYMK